MAIGDVGSIGFSVGIANFGPIDRIASATLADADMAVIPEATIAATSVSLSSPFNAAAQLNTLVQGLNNLAATSSVLQPFADQLMQLNTMVANVDANMPLAQQPVSDTVAALLLALLDEMNRQRQDSGSNGSPLMDLILAQTLTQPTVGVFINTSA